MRRILIYNWTLIDDSLGGGVTVYVRNILSELETDKDFEVFYLNSGLNYDKSRKIYIRKTSNSFKKVKSYEIVNSPVLAPSLQSIKNIEIAINDKKLASVFLNFVKENKIDIIHFNNLEGLSLKCFNIKKIFPNIRLIYSAHNYFPLCSRVDLWQDDKFANGHNCNKQSYAECINCYDQAKYYLEIFRRKHPFKNSRQKIKKIARYFPDRGDINSYSIYHERLISFLNNEVDCVLAVSKRVKKIFEEHGVNSDKITVSYIGNDMADVQLNKCAADINADPFRLLYMGYARRVKGFDFFIKALKDLPDEYASKMILRIASHLDSDYEKIVDGIKGKFAGFEFYDGYSRDNQKEILTDVNLGVVPIMWEDNLPQVGIEQIASGVPILVSDRGGVSELCNNDNFVFHAGDTTDFLKKLVNIYKNRDLLKCFFYNSMKLVTRDEHYNKIKKIYCN